MHTIHTCVVYVAYIPVKVTVPTRSSISGATPSLCRNRLLWKGEKAHTLTLHTHTHTHTHTHICTHHTKTSQVSRET